MEKEFCNKKVESSITVERHNSLQRTAWTRAQTQTHVLARTRILPTPCLLAIFIQCRCWWWCRCRCRCRHLTGHYSKKGRLSRSPNVTRMFRVAQGNAGRWRKGFWVRPGFVWLCASASAVAGWQVSMQGYRTRCSSRINETVLMLRGPNGNAEHIMGLSTITWDGMKANTYTAGIMDAEMSKARLQ